MKEVEVVGAVIYDHTQGYLCALRGENMSLAGFWEFPGGKVEAGEDHKAALIREIKEELSCSIVIGDHITSVSHDYDHLRVHLHTYWATFEEGRPTAKEHEELRWVTLQELNQLNWAPADIPTVDKLLESKKT